MLLASPRALAWSSRRKLERPPDPERGRHVYLSAATGPIRCHYRQKINALVYQAIME